MKGILISFFVAAIFSGLRWLWKSVPVWLRTNRTLEQEIGALKSSVEQERTKVFKLSEEYNKLDEMYVKLQHQKKSSEVKTGATVEQLASFLEDFPYPDDEIKGMFQPVDLIVFRENEIVFVEIKSGDSQLSEKQRKIRDLIEQKSVRFEVHRINGKGYKVK